MLPFPNTGLSSVSLCVDSLTMGLDVTHGLPTQLQALRSRLPCQSAMGPSCTSGICLFCASQATVMALKRRNRGGRATWVDMASKTENGPAVDQSEPQLLSATVGTTHWGCGAHDQGLRHMTRSVRHRGFVPSCICSLLAYLTWDMLSFTADITLWLLHTYACAPDRLCSLLLAGLEAG